MAAGELRSRFGCLTLARIVVSVVALAFGAAVLVVVLTSGPSPNNPSLSVTRGHIQSAGLLWSKKDFLIEHLRRSSNTFETTTFYAPAKELSVWVSMNAHDPTRRAAKVCVDAVHVLDMPHAPSFDGMVDIATVHNMVATGNANKSCTPWRKNRSADMQLERSVTLDDPLMLCYISQKYGGINNFTVMLKVDIRILYPAGDRDKAIITYYCWPVTIGNTLRINSEDVTCKPSNAFDYASFAPVLSASDHLTAHQQRICFVYKEI